MRILKWIGIGFAGLLLLLAAIIAVWWFKTYTPSIDGPDPIAEIRTVEINGDPQVMLIRGADRSKPILLFLHGGPGMPMMFLAHKFQRPLEKDFVTVQWDRRAAGKSWGDEDPADMRISQYVDDVVAAIRYVTRELGQDRVILAGHSHGSYLGAIVAARHPELVRAFVGLGQVADEDEAFEVQKRELERRFPGTEVTMANREQLLFESGAEIHGETSMWPLIRDGMLAPEYSLRDVMNVAKGPQFASRHMRYDVLDGPLEDEVTRFEVPVYVIMGRHDLVTPVTLARRYFERIQAPEKAFILFPNSAHFPMYEEPQRFAAVMRAIAEAMEANTP
jgi:pimeloyl-ACP methyl ester carboxylesterase